MKRASGIVGIFLIGAIASFAVDTLAQVHPPQTPTPTPGSPVSVVGKSNASGTGTQRTALVTTASRLAVDVGTASITGTISGTVAATQSGTWTVQPGNTANTTAWKVDGSAVTQPVSGTFWQATQPVSGTVTANQGGAPWSVSQSGTWLATQTGTWNIGTVTAVTGITNPLPAGSNVIGHVIADTGSTTAVTGNVTVVQGTGTNLHTVVDSAPTTAVTNAGLTNLDVALSTRTKPADQQHAIIDSGTTTVTQGTGTNLHTVVDSGTTAATQSGTWTVQPGNTANTTAWKVDGSAVTQPVSGTVAATESGTWTVQPGNTANTTAWLVAGATLTKGTQGSTGFSVQDLKDAGRSYVTLTATGIAGVTSETAVTFTKNVAGTATASQTTYTITNAKKLRCTAFSFSNRAGTTTTSWGRISLRHATGGSCGAASALVYTMESGSFAALAGSVGTSSAVAIPDGIEFAGDGTAQICLSHISQATTNVETASLSCYEY